MLRRRWASSAVTVSAVVLCGCSSQVESISTGNSPDLNRDEVFAEKLQDDFGITMGSGVAAEMAQAGCEAPGAGVGLYDAWQAMQQKYPEFSLNTVSTVMGQGVLIYCPERLS